MGYGLVNVFIEHLQVVATNNYNTIPTSTLYKLLHAKSSPACSVFTSRCLVIALNNEDSSASVLMLLPAG
jgi:hypothetical protein